MMQDSSQPSFYGLGIAPGILEVLERMRFKVPTPIQFQAIPIVLQGKDIVGIAQTGTGKTLAFGIPMLQAILQGPGRALVIVPTRELALQVDETLRKIGQPFHVHTAVLIGGAPMGPQLHSLRRPSTRVYIATPGRLVDHLEQKTVRLSDIKVLVLDEADRMLDMGFAPQIRRIEQHLPKERQTLLFSATMPEAIVKIATSLMKLPIRVEIARSGTAAEKVSQELFIVRHEAKRTLLLKLVQECRGSVLVFARTKIGAKKITKALRASNQSAAEIHSDRSLSQRREALDGFKTGRYRILVATDIAARGIDVKGIELVINYDLPEDSENYIHRIGRTGRAGREGKAISIATPDQEGNVRDIEKLMRSNLRVASHPEFPPERFSRSGQSQHAAHRPQRPHGRPRFFGGRPGRPR